jgi:hypothetical protein
MLECRFFTDGWVVQSPVLGRKALQCLLVPLGSLIHVKWIGTNTWNNSGVSSCDAAPSPHPLRPHPGSWRKPSDARVSAQATNGGHRELPATRAA